MTALLVENTASEPCPLDFTGDTSPLVYFMSFAVAERFGAQHELAEAAAALKRKHKINLTPLLRFGNAEAESEADAADLETLWQEAIPLAEAARMTAETIRATPALREELQAYPELVERLLELSAIASWAGARNAKVRLTYLL